MSSTKGINRQLLAERLTAVFEATGESQREIADRTGVAQSFVSKVARGVCLPSLELLVGLDEAYGISIVWVLRGEGEMRTQRVAPLPVRRPAPPKPPIIDLAEQALAIGGEVLANIEGYMRGRLAAPERQPQQGRRMTLRLVWDQEK